MTRMPFFVRLFWMRFIRLLYVIADKFPFWGTRFWLAGWKAHKMALYEFIFTILFSTTPLWLGGMLIVAIDPDTQDSFEGFLATLIALISRGDLFLYCTSVLTAIAWLNIKHSINVDNNEQESQSQTEDIDELREKLNLQGSSEAILGIKRYKSVYPPNKFLFLSFALLGFIISVAFYALNLAEIIVSPEYIRHISLLLYAISLGLYHNILVSDHAGFELFEKRVADETHEFLMGYQAHREGGKQ